MAAHNKGAGVIPPLLIGRNDGPDMEIEKWEKRLALVKYLVLVILAILFFSNWRLDPVTLAGFIEYEGLKYSEDVRAPIYALLAAFALMASLFNFPPQGEPKERWLPNMMLGVFSVVAAAAAAWGWLEATTKATDATPWPYLWMVGVTTTIMVGYFCIGIFAGWISDTITRARAHKDGNNPAND